MVRVQSWPLVVLLLATSLVGCQPQAGATTATPAGTAIVASATPTAPAPTPTTVPLPTATAVIPTSTAAPTVAPAGASPTPSARPATAVPLPSVPAGAPKETPVSGVPVPQPLDPYVQGLVNQAKDDLAKRTGLRAEQIELVAARAVTWSDGSLGCPQPGMAYTQALVDGLLLQLRAAGRTYEYHSGGTRAPFLCENPTRPVS